MTDSNLLGEVVEELCLEVHCQQQVLELEVLDWLVSPY